MKSILPNEILALFSIFKEHHQQLYLVGGSVRNYLLQLPIHDYDFATDADIDKMQYMFIAYPFSVHVNPTFQNVSIKMGNYKIEITRYRMEANYQNYRSPNSMIATNKFYMDILRRDFTCNTLAYHPDFGIIDYLHANHHIIKKKLRCVKDANTTFSQDVLRIYRALKLHVAYGFTFSSSSYDAIKKNTSNLKYLSISYHMDFLSFLLFCNCSYRFQLLYHFNILSLIWEHFHIQIPKEYAYTFVLQLDQQYHTLSSNPSLAIAALLLSLYPYHQETCSIITFAKKILSNISITKNQKQDIYRLLKEIIFDIQQHTIFYAISKYDPIFLSNLLQLQLAFQPNDMKLCMFLQQFELIKKENPCFLSSSIGIQRKDLLPYRSNSLSLQCLFQKLHEYLLTYPQKNNEKEILEWLKSQI